MFAQKIAQSSFLGLRSFFYENDKDLSHKPLCSEVTQECPQNSTTFGASREALQSSSQQSPSLTASQAFNKSMSKAENRQEVKKILENKSSFMEKASRRASALNLTRLCPTLVLATGSATLRQSHCIKVSTIFVKIFVVL